MASSEPTDMQAWRNELWMLKLWHPLYGQGSQKRSVLDNALDELTALRKEREQLIGTIDEWRDRLDTITPKDLEAAWHVVNRAVTGEAEDRASGKRAAIMTWYEVLSAESRNLAWCRNQEDADAVMQRHEGSWMREFHGMLAQVVYSGHAEPSPGLIAESRADGVLPTPESEASDAL